MKISKKPFNCTQYSKVHHHVIELCNVSVSNERGEINKKKNLFMWVFKVDVNPGRDKEA